MDSWDIATINELNSFKKKKLSSRNYSIIIYFPEN